MSCGVKTRAKGAGEMLGRSRFEKLNPCRKRLKGVGFPTSFPLHFFRVVRPERSSVRQRGRRSGEGEGGPPARTVLQ